MLSIGEPRQSPPGFIQQALINHQDGLAKYPSTRGLPELRQTIAEWLSRRFSLPADGVSAETQVLPVNGTREALFAFAQCVIDPTRPATVVMPNPFYQIYEGAALLAGAEPYYLNTTQQNGYLPDFNAVPDSVWHSCQLLYICSPGNPSGAVIDQSTLERLIHLAQQFDFVIAADECYSELYHDESAPPVGLLQAAQAIGNDAFKNCVVFHSLSKRSNAPGLRSGFVAGDAALLERFTLYRTYHGCAMPLPTQHASIAAWQDELHVQQNRVGYREKFAAVMAILADSGCVEQPPASFYLWFRTPTDDREFAYRLYAEENVTVLPGSFLSRHWQGVDPGANHIRIALVQPLESCIEAAQRIARLLQ